MIYQFILLLFTIYMVISLIKNKEHQILLLKLAKIASLIYAILFFIHLFFPDAYSIRIYPEQAQYQDIFNRVYSLVRWLEAMNLVLLIVTLYSNNSLLKKISYIISPISFLLLIISFQVTLKWYTTPCNEGIGVIRFFNPIVQKILTNKEFRSFTMTLNYAFLGIATIFNFASFKKAEQKTSKKETIKSILLVLGMLFVTIPIYVPSYLQGGYDLEEAGFFKIFSIGSFQHILWILFLPLETFILYKIMKPMNKENRYFMLLFLSIALFYQFNGIFTCFGEITTKRYPIQPCNFASVLLLPCMLYKPKTLSKLFYSFHLLGAFIAVVMCDSSNCGISYIMNIHYIVEHSKIIYIPILALLLGVFEVPKKEGFKDVILGFTSYFILALLLGVTFNAVYEITGNDYFINNYLFMIDKAATAKLAGFVKPLFDLKITLFNHFHLNLFQLLVYVVLGSLSVLIYLLFVKIMNKKKTAN